MLVEIPFRQTIAQFIRFGVVGSLGTVVNLIIFEGVRWAGIHYLPAASVSFLGVATGNYLLNSRWTFQKSRASAKDWILYVGINLIGLGANLAVLSCFTELWHWPVSLAQLAGIGAGTILNFAFSKALVFR